MVKIIKNIFYYGLILTILLSTNLNIYKTSCFNSYYISLRRIRDISKKEKIVVDHFVEGLKAKFGERILETYLVPKELREEDEGIDIVIVYEGMDRREFFDEAAKITYQICGDYDEVIIPIAIPKSEYEEILKKFSNLNKFFKSLIYPEEQNPREGTIKLHNKMGIEFLDAAKFSLEKNNFFAAFANAFLASEHFMSAIILYSHQKGVAKSHRGILKQFQAIPDTIFGRKRKFKYDVWGIMTEALSRRAVYFYEGKEVIEREDVELIERIIKIATGLKNFIERNIP
jgi:uncharacterized protein (UPF0332 family)